MKTKHVKLLDAAPLPLNYTHGIARVLQTTDYTAVFRYRQEDSQYGV